MAKLKANLLVLSIFWGFFFHMSLAGAQTAPPNLTDTPAASASGTATSSNSNGVLAPTNSTQKLDQLQIIQRDIAFLSNEIIEKRKEEAEAGKDEIADIRAELLDLEQRLQKAKLSFIAVASDVELPTPEPQGQPKKRDLLQEAQQLVEPLFDAIHRVSEKPRRIEAYNSKIYALTKDLEQTSKAIGNLRQVLNAKAFPGFDTQLNESIQALSHNQDEDQVQLATLQRKLAQELSDHRTVLQVVSETVSEFFASKGRNLLIAILVFIFSLWALLYFRHTVFALPPVHKFLAGYHKPARLLYNIGAVLVSLIAVVVTLHFLNDWFMVSIILLMILIALWSSKALVAHFLNEVKLILNLGSVRLGERVVWMGIPWSVESLGFRSVLVNEALQGGRVTLAAATLVGMYSRSTVEAEPWFPTQVGDFVQLDDGIYGQVKTQTLETVVVQAGEAFKHYGTSHFLARNPQNFSKGFALSYDFTTRHNLNISEVEKHLQAARKRVQNQLAANSAFKDPQVSTQTAGTQVIRILMSVSVDGSLAHQRDALKTALQAAAGQAWFSAIADKSP